MILFIILAVNVHESLSIQNATVIIKYSLSLMTIIIFITVITLISNIILFVWLVYRLLCTMMKPYFKHKLHIL